MHLKTTSGEKIFLTYCLNLHNGETLAEIEQTLFTYAASVLSRFLPEVSSRAVGPWFNYRIACELLDTDKLSDLKQKFIDSNLFPITLNGFPFGIFHNQRVKEQVYLPDWSSPQRLEYTLNLLKILSYLLKDNIVGSISTLPVGYAALCNKDTIKRGAENMAECAWHFHKCLEESRKDIVLCVEPEPDCVAGDLDSFLKFYNDHLLRTGSRYLGRAYGVSASVAEKMIRRHVGICMDTVHCAVCNEDLVEGLHKLGKEGIRIGKIQLGAALRADGPAFSKLASFHDPVYLHQTRFYQDDSCKCYADLNDFLSDKDHLDRGHALVHYHMPFTWEGRENLSAHHGVTLEFLEKSMAMGVCCYELEIYTLLIFPQLINADTKDKNNIISDILTAELRWLMEKFDATTPLQET